MLNNNNTQIESTTMGYQKSFSNVNPKPKRTSDRTTSPIPPKALP